MSARTFQDVIQTLNRYWAAQGCVLLQPLDTEVGTGTFHRAKFLRSLRPGENWGGSESMEGGEGLGLGDGTGVFQDLADLDELSDQLSQSYNGSRLDDLDLDALARQLGDEAVVDARTLQASERALRDSDSVKRGSDGQLKLTLRTILSAGSKLDF